MKSTKLYTLNLAISIFLLSTLFPFLCLSQVFIPFSFWQGRGPLAADPSGIIYLLPGDSLIFSATGGNLIYSWSATAGAISDGALLNNDVITPVTGTNMDYTSRATTYQNDIVTLTSGAANVNITVHTYDDIFILPSNLTMAISTTQDFSVFNGYCTAIPGACTDATATWSIFSGDGTISAAGLFTAPATAGVTVIQAADNTGHTATVTVTVVASLTIATPNLSSFQLKLPVYSTANFSAILGVTPYTYSIASGGGGLGCGTTLSGNIAAGATSIPVVSTASCPQQGVIFIGTEQICYSSINATTFLGTAFQGTTVIRGCNGSTAAAASTGATVNGNRSVYTAASSVGSATVRVTDNSTNTSDANLTIIRPVEIAMGYAFACVRFGEGSVKCWGENTNGQIGNNSTNAIGDLGTEVGGSIPLVSLGVGRTATKIVAGNQHACALLDNSTIRCWGDNAYGQIGNGNTTDQRLPALVSVGARVPIDVWAFGFMTCAKLNDNSAVCWGLNTLGQAGQGTLTNIVTPPLTALNFGGGRAASQFVGSNSGTCARLSDGSVQCWGENSTDGQLGYGDFTDRTSPSGTSVNLGVGRVAQDIGGQTTTGTGTTNEGTFCAALDDGTIRCWGDNRRGQIGDASITDRNVPTLTATLGLTANKVKVGREFTCVLSNIGLVKCWGRNQRGTLGVGDVADRTSAGYCSPTLNGAHTNVVTTITVNSTTGCAVPSSPSGQGKIYVGSEIICYTGMSGTQFTGATRGCDGTMASAHSNGAQVLGFNSFGPGVLANSLATGGRVSCILTSGGILNNDRVKCWGIQVNMAGSAVHGLFLYHSTSTSNGNNTSCIGDGVGEIGDNIPFLNL